MTSAQHGDHSAARRHLIALALLLALGLAVRLLLVLVVYPGQGFSSDMDLFIQWGRGLLQRGPAHFYGGDSSANYPPLSIWMFGGLSALSGLFGGDSAAVLVKVPGAVADVGIAMVVHRLVVTRSGSTAALAAAAIALAIPVFWYDSTLWGQIESIEVLLSLAALALLVGDRPVGATAMAMAAWLFKPQGVLVLVVVGTVIVVAVVRRGLDGTWTGPLPKTSRPPTLVLAIGTAIAALLVVVVPFDYERLATGPLAGLPVLGDLAGLLQQNLSTAALFPVLTANAFNGWALVGHPSLAASISGPTAAWYLDTAPVLGVPASSIGLTGLAVIVLAVVVGLCVRLDGTAVLLAFTVLAVAFFAIPTRAHERYLVGAFATMVVLAADSIIKVVATVALSIVNTVNLHAVLAGGPGVSVQQMASRAASPPGVATLIAARGGPDTATSASATLRGLQDGVMRPITTGALGSGNARTGPAGTDLFAHASYIALPWGAAARQEWVVVACSIAQTGAALVLLGGWIAFIARPANPGARRRRATGGGPQRSSRTAAGVDGVDRS